MPLTHVPYKGMSPAINDVAGGHIPFMFSPIPFALPLAQAGKLRMLGVTTAERIEAIPDVRRSTEIGAQGFRRGVLVHAGGAGRHAGRHRRHGSTGRSRAIIGDPEVRAELTRLGLLPVQSPPPDELRRFVAAEIVRWGEYRAGRPG